MSGLADVFTPDGFGLATLTAGIQKLPPSPQTIAELGVFREVPIATTMVAIEENRGVLALIPTTKRGGPGTTGAPEKRKVFALTVPHVQVDDTIQADDVLNVRAFGTQDQNAVVSQLVAQKFIPMRRSLEATIEFLRMRALHGLIVYPTGSVDANVDLHTAFGATNLATDETVVDFVLSTGTTDVMGKCATVRDYMEAALGGTPYTGIYCLCGREFFRALCVHAEVHKLYLEQQAIFGAAMMGQVGLGAGNRVNRQKLVFGGITFEEYYGFTSGLYSIGDATPTEANAANRWARFFPLGADVLHTYYAPADRVEAVGTLGQPMYASQYLSEDGKSVRLEAQSNPLSICVRPKCLIKGIRHTGD